ncbi:DUF3794 and LysM peptidoglycan-binding domain-containing protein [Ammonifex thiophilus]|uniref:DUF3794 domain-containing protein n=1 Tax=Ammonifex thiophilus TaxID=444093 RepID=A0A3D8P862_9THEO|nr:SPOCS domain-containing protein [Ammonifex thiophilus]RDV84619.1 DUF3794 domain-containing protein [Ammonifex thiophilus]
MSCVGKYLLLKLNQVLAEASSSHRLEREVRLRAEDPEVESLLSLRPEVRIDSVQVLAGRVLWEGQLVLKLDYVACCPGKPVYTARVSLPLAEVVEVAEARPGMAASVAAEVKEISLRPEKTCSRKLYLTALVTAQVKLTALKELEVLVEPPPGLKVTTKKLKVENVVSSARAQCFLAREERLPIDKPSLREVVSTLASCKNVRAEVKRGGVMVCGEVEFRVLYAADDASPVYEVRFTLPWEHFVTIEGVVPGLEIRALADKVTVKAKAKPKGRIPTRELELEALVDFQVMVGKVIEAEVVTGVEGETEVTKLRVWLEQVVGEKEKEELIRREVVPTVDPPVEEILAAEPMLAVVRETDILDGMVLVKGEGLVRVIYTAKGTGKVHALDVDLPFSLALPLPSAKPEHQISAQAEPVYARAKLAEKGKVAVEVLMAVKVKVTERVQEEVVTCVRLPAAKGRLLKYTISPGDTLYRLAQRFSTTVEAIMAANPGIDPYNLQVGQVIFIPCRF